MVGAMRNANVNPDQVDYLNAHGTSTPLGDINETNAIKAALGDHAKNLTISSTKSMTGHLLGAAGAIEAIATVLAIHCDHMPPTMNLHHPDPACDLDYLALRAREGRVEVAMSNSMGFGGHNVSLIFRKFL